MSTLLPISLCGKNLGERHRHLNTLVEESYQKAVPFESIQNFSEQSAIDRIFKIDLASKYRHIQYIIQNLKDDNMLYVSRALRCLWLLEPQYRDVINPTYLENVLFPEMLTTAVNKMKHWIYQHLRDAERCQEFFLYYSSNIDIAIKFLWHCTTDFISDVFGNILENISPQHMKFLCEKCPQAVKIYFDMLPKNKKLLSIYLANEMKYYLSIRSLLKIEAELFLDITEKYYNTYKFKRFSSAATFYIMDKHRGRFNNKPELYTAMLLDTKALAKCLSTSEVKDLVLKLAQAKYIDSWFSYKNIEPLIIRLPRDERSLFKKQVFVDKSIGEWINEWPYSIPCPPKMEDTSTTQDDNHVFVDVEDYYDYYMDFKAMVKKRKLRMWESSKRNRMITFENIFDMYRFASFKKTFIKLEKQMLAESSSQIREYMMLVLVSKSGGHPENVEQLLELLLRRHANEPSNIRAAVVRSMVKRAQVWQMPSTVWQMFLKFAQGLGLDGNKANVECDEGLHAVVLRYILSTGNCPLEIFIKFLERFSTFKEYKLNSTEKKYLLEKLPQILVPTPDVEPAQAVIQLLKLLNVLEDYHIRLDKYPAILSIIISFIKQHLSICGELLNRLFRNRIARKELFRENFSHNQNNASYLNALRRDSSILLNNNKFSELVKSKMHHDGFLRKLSIYFSERRGIAERYLEILDSECTKVPHAYLARPVALLAGPSLGQRLQKLERNTNIQKQYAAALWANAHLANVKFDLDDTTWTAADIKAIANRVLICQYTKIDEYLNKLMADRRTIKLAIMLALRSGQEGVVFRKAVNLRPILTVKYSFQYIRQRGDAFDQRVWEAVKPVIMKLDLNKYKKLQESVDKVQTIPHRIRVEYCCIVYSVLRRVARYKAIKVLRRLDSTLGDVDEEIIVDVIKDFINNFLTLDNISNEQTYSDKKLVQLHLWVTVKYLLLCRSEEAQKQRMTLIGEPVLNKIKSLWLDKVNRCTILTMLDHILFYLKHSHVFFDGAYVSSVPVFEREAEWMQQIFPVTMYFKKYVTLHLTMLYCKSIRQCVKHKPDIFSDPVKTINEGVLIVGTTFGKYLAYEIKDLTKKYFDSIVELYSKEMSVYLWKYFSSHESRDTFIWCILKGFLSECRHDDTRLAMYILKEFQYQQGPGNEEVYNILKQIDDVQIKYYLYALL
ncbi:uncharacterized protein LOC113523219 [Galleria mellonella]|uniref:Uncharacterized protein LOC113523219 n=1 Tax=Galleria mellonella TaxID=7137 RepID=A0A6J1X5U4_GALME|nr:uncharacterized protein LOC113523219 [Galleria mellonella]XP_026764903.2 uncharacterized protein LOC113523219 [Galleria mellonella]